MNASLVNMDDMLGSTNTVTRGKKTAKRQPRSTGAMPSLSTYGAARPNLMGMNQGMGMSPQGRGMMPPQGRGMGMMNPGMNQFNQFQQQRSPQMGFGQPQMGYQQNQMPMGFNQ